MGLRTASVDSPANRLYRTQGHQGDSSTSHQHQSENPGCPESSFDSLEIPLKAVANLQEGDDHFLVFLVSICHYLLCHLHKPHDLWAQVSPCVKQGQTLPILSARRQEVDQTLEGISSSQLKTRGKEGGVGQGTLF